MFEIKDEHKVKILNWYNRHRKRLFIISGYAGCGKTTLAKLIPNLLDLADETMFLAPTGKAAEVIGLKARTIHSYLYDAVVDPETNEITFLKKEAGSLEEELLIVDEISMVPDEILNDLRELNIPIIGLGDPAQLPPVNGKNSVLSAPDIFLTEVFRNDGGILALATDIRNKVKIRSWKYNDVELRLGSIDQDLKDIEIDSAIIVKFNKTRTHINRLYRKEVLGFTSIIQNGEKLIVTKNNSMTRLNNGSIVTVEEIEKIYVDELMAKVRVRTSDDQEMSIVINLDTLMNRDVRKLNNKMIHEVDYAYAITCHKAQGSEYKKVYIINEGKFMEGHSAWFYTAVTRAKEKVIIYN